MPRSGQRQSSGQFGHDETGRVGAADGRVKDARRGGFIYSAVDAPCTWASGHQLFRDAVSVPNATHHHSVVDLPLRLRVRAWKKVRLVTARHETKCLGTLGRRPPQQSNSGWPDRFGSPRPERLDGSRWKFERRRGFEEILYP